MSQDEVKMQKLMKMSMLIFLCHRISVYLVFLYNFFQSLEKSWFELKNHFLFNFNQDILKKRHNPGNKVGFTK